MYAQKPCPVIVDAALPEHAAALCTAVHSCLWDPIHIAAPPPGGS